MTNLHYYRDSQDNQYRNYQHHKAQLRSTIHKEHRLATRKLGIIIGLILLALWIGDWILDAENAMRALPYRLACAAILILHAAYKPNDYPIAVDAAVTYASLLGCELLFLGVARSLNNGYGIGLSGIICILAATLILCAAYPFFFNLIGTLLLAILPLPAAGILLGEAANHQLYISAILPFTLILLLVQQQKRRLIVERQHYRLKSETLAIMPGIGSPTISAIREFCQKFEQITAGTGRHTLLRIRIMETGNPNQENCPSLDAMNQQKIGEIIHNALRSRDMLAHLKGLEYFCLLADTDESTAAIAAERLRSHLNLAELGCPSQECFRLDPSSIVIERYLVDSFDGLIVLFRQFGYSLAPLTS